MGERQLKCEVSKGMFSNEVVVNYLRGGQKVSVFVPKDMVTQTGQGATVRVRVYPAGDGLCAVLPTEDQLLIFVRAEDLI